MEGTQSFVQVYIYGWSLLDLRNRDIDIKQLLASVGISDCVLVESAIDVNGRLLSGPTKRRRRCSSNSSLSFSCYSDQEIKKEPYDDSFQETEEAVMNAPDSSSREDRLFNCSLSTIYPSDEISVRTGSARSVNGLSGVVPDQDQLNDNCFPMAAINSVCQKVNPGWVTPRIQHCSTVPNNVNLVKPTIYPFQSYSSSIEIRPLAVLPREDVARNAARNDTILADPAILDKIRKANHQRSIDGDFDLSMSNVSAALGQRLSPSERVETQRSCSRDEELVSHMEVSVDLNKDKNADKILLIESDGKQLPCRMETEFRQSIRSEKNVGVDQQSLCSNEGFDDFFDCSEYPDLNSSVTGENELSALNEVSDAVETVESRSGEFCLQPEPTVTVQPDVFISSFLSVLSEQLDDDVRNTVNGLLDGVERSSMASGNEELSVGGLANAVGRIEKQPDEFCVQPKCPVQPDVLTSPARSFSSAQLSDDIRNTITGLLDGVDRMDVTCFATSNLKPQNQNTTSTTSTHGEESLLDSSIVQSLDLSATEYKVRMVNNESGHAEQDEQLYENLEDSSIRDAVLPRTSPAKDSSQEIQDDDAVLPRTSPAKDSSQEIQDDGDGVLFQNSSDNVNLLDDGANAEVEEVVVELPMETDAFNDSTGNASIELSFFSVEGDREQSHNGSVTIIDIDEFEEANEDMPGQDEEGSKNRYSRRLRNGRFNWKGALLPFAKPARTPSKRGLGSVKEEIKEMVVLRCTFPDCHSVLKWRPGFGKQRVLDHLRTHTVKNTKLCPVEGCEFAGKTAYAVRNHFRSEHRGKPGDIIDVETQDDFEHLLRMWGDCYPDCPKKYIVGRRSVKMEIDE